jgi:hypothetical protein
MGDPGVKAGRRILVVEDDLVIANAVSRRLVSEGFRVDAVHDGPDARPCGNVSGESAFPAWGRCGIRTTGYASSSSPTQRKPDPDRQPSRLRGAVYQLRPGTGRPGEDSEGAGQSGDVARCFAAAVGELQHDLRGVLPQADDLGPRTISTPSVRARSSSRCSVAL